MSQSFRSVPRPFGVGAYYLANVITCDACGTEIVAPYYPKPVRYDEGWSRQSLPCLVMHGGVFTRPVAPRNLDLCPKCSPAYVAMVARWLAGRRKAMP